MKEKCQDIFIIEVRTLVSMLVFVVNRFMSLLEFLCHLKWSQTFVQSALGSTTFPLFINSHTVLLCIVLYTKHAAHMYINVNSSTYNACQW